MWKIASLGPWGVGFKCYCCASRCVFRDVHLCKQHWFGSKLEDGVTQTIQESS